MENTALMTEMIGQCRSMIAGKQSPVPEQLPPLRKEHLVWMCDRMLEHVESWPAAKLNRWVGFIQCAMIANGYVDLAGAKAMFDLAKNAYGEPDQDMLDHLNPDVDFEIEIGGRG